jgi:hypothetical protein
MSRVQPEKPFERLVFLSMLSVILSIIALLASLRVHDFLAFFSFLPFVVLFSLVTVRIRGLMLACQRSGVRVEPKLRDLPFVDRALVALWFCGFWIFLGLGVYFLGWYPA